MKKVLFLAPGYQYAKTVVRNTSRDLNNANIPFTSSNEPKNMYIRTNEVDVTITYDDPIIWSSEMLHGVHAVYGKKELLAKLEEMAFYMMPATPPVSFIRYIKMNSVKEKPQTDIPPKTKYIPEIKNAYFNDPVTIVMWDDGTKTMVRCQDGDTYSAETGLAVCIAKKALGNKGNFNNIFKKWLPIETEPETMTLEYGPTMQHVLNKVKEAMRNMKGE